MPKSAQQCVHAYDYARIVTGSNPTVSAVLNPRELRVFCLPSNIYIKVSGK